MVRSTESLQRLWNASGINPAFLPVFLNWWTTRATIGLTGPADFWYAGGRSFHRGKCHSKSPPYFLTPGATNLESTTLTGASGTCSTRRPACLRGRTCAHQAGDHICDISATNELPSLPGGCRSGTVSDAGGAAHSGPALLAVVHLSCFLTTTTLLSTTTALVV